VIRLIPGFTVGVREESGAFADMTGCTNLTVSVLRPDESVVERAAKVTEDPTRIEIQWEPQDMSLAGLYRGEVRGRRASGEDFVLTNAFKLYHG